jgi:hypothetical protein
VWWRIEAESKLVVAKRPRAKGRQARRRGGMASFACDPAPKSAGLATSVRGVESLQDTFEIVAPGASMWFSGLDVCD